jgi:N-acetyl-anhydromuramyl-L-alanine amidase AmpD
MRRTICLLGVLGTSGCAIDVVVDSTSPVVQTGLDEEFADAAARRGVPGDLLKAISYVETRWQHIATTGHEDGEPGAYGVMALGGARLTRAASLIDVSDDAAADDVSVNIDAAAALLADAARRAGVPAGASLQAWLPAVVEYADGIVDAEARTAYGAQVYDVLRTGAMEQAESGDSIANLPPNPSMPVAGGGGPQQATDDYAGATWRASPNFSSRPSGVTPSMVIIHTCEGAYAGCWGWLRNTSSGVSAHYVVKEDGAEITQLVREASKAWHIAATYKCSLNGGVACNRDGQSSNNFTIGIEHAGFASQASFPNGQIEASARLVCDITKSHGIAIDRNHIVGHGQLQPYNRVDPGPNWPWAHFIDRVRLHCEGVTNPDPDDPTPPPPPPTTQIIVDSNNANNDQTRARIELAGSWTSASSTPGYYGTGYWYGGSTTSDSPAAFYFYLPAAQTRSVDAWWTSGTNRSSGATWVAFNASGAEVGRATISQQSQGSQWAPLGTWSFSAGWNRVELRQRVASGKVVIADGIRVR